MGVRGNGSGCAPALEAPAGRRRPRHRMPALAILVIVAWAAASATAAPVRAAGVSVDLDQWASLANAWQNGNLNGNNARYPEGGVIPFRVAIEGLKAGAHSITISYDFTASGHKAYDFLASWNATNAPNLCAKSGGAISSMCPRLPAPSSAAFPSDPYRANGLTVRGAEAWSGAPRRLTIYGGTITSIEGPVHHGSPDGNSTGEFHVRFRSTASAVLLVWGGHLAQSAYWDVVGGGARDGAAMVSGAPWHMRTLGLDGGGNRNQDRSIQPSAVVGELPPYYLSPTPTPRPASPPGTGTPTGPGTPPGPGGPAGPGSSTRPTVPPTTAEERPPTGRGPDPLGIVVMALALVVATGVVARSTATRDRRRGRQR